MINCKLLIIAKKNILYIPCFNWNFNPKRNAKGILIIIEDSIPLILNKLLKKAI